MPIYDYTCPECESSESRRPSVAQRDEQTCSGCGEKLDRDVITAPAVNFGEHRAVPRGSGHAPTPKPKHAGHGSIISKGKYAGVDTSALPFVDRGGKLREAGTGKVLAE